MKEILLILSVSFVCLLLHAEIVVQEDRQMARVHPPMLCSGTGWWPGTGLSFDVQLHITSLLEQLWPQKSMEITKANRILHE